LQHPPLLDNASDQNNFGWSLLPPQAETPHSMPKPATEIQAARSPPNPFGTSSVAASKAPADPRPKAEDAPAVAALPPDPFATPLPPLPKNGPVDGTTKSSAKAKLVDVPKPGAASTTTNSFPPQAPAASAAVGLAPQFPHAVKQQQATPPSVATTSSNQRRPVGFLDEEAVDTVDLSVAIRHPPQVSATAAASGVDDDNVFVTEEDIRIELRSLLMAMHDFESLIKSKTANETLSGLEEALGLKRTSSSRCD
jgi:hypothetical protein